MIPVRILERPRVLTEFVAEMDIKAGLIEGGVESTQASLDATEKVSAKVPEPNTETEYDVPDAQKQEAVLQEFEGLFKKNMVIQAEKEKGGGDKSGRPGKKRADNIDASGMEESLVQMMGEANSTKAPSDAPKEFLPIVPLTPPDPNQFAGLQRSKRDVAERAVDALLRVVLKPGALNGPSKDGRIGFKHGDFVFVQEELLRHAAEVVLQIQSREQPPPTGGLTGFAKAVMWGLYDKGALVNEFDGKVFSPNTAVFDIAGRNSKGKSTRPLRCCIIFRAALDERLCRIKDCQSKPEIIAAFWPQKAYKGARNEVDEKGAHLPWEDGQGAGEPLEPKTTEANHSANAVTTESAQDATQPHHDKQEAIM